MAPLQAIEGSRGFARGNESGTAEVDAPLSLAETGALAFLLEDAARAPFGTSGRPSWPGLRFAVAKSAKRCFHLTAKTPPAPLLRLSPQSHLALWGPFAAGKGFLTLPPAAQARPSRV